MERALDLAFEAAICNCYITKTVPHRRLLRILELLYVGASGSGQLPRQLEKVLKRYSSHNQNKSKGPSERAVCGHRCARATGVGIDEVCG